MASGLPAPVCTQAATRHTTRSTTWLFLFKMACAALYVLSTRDAAAADDALRIIGDTTPVQIYVTVTANDGTPIGNLASGAFQLSEDSSAQTVTSATTTTDEPVTTVFVMDYSKSMRNTGSVPPMEAAVKGFIDTMEPDDEAAIIKFNNSAVVSQDLTTDTDLLKAAVDASPGNQGNSKLYDALDKALDVIALSGNTAGTRSIVVLSDGDDVNSTISLADLSTHLDAANIPVFTIGYGPSINTDVMQGLADGTGGLYYSASNDSGQFADIYADISERLNNEYHLTYLSAISDCNVHELQVQVATTEGTKTYSGSFRRCFTTDPIPEPEPEPTPGKKHGGGALDTWGLSALTLAAWLHRRRRRAQQRAS